MFYRDINRRAPRDHSVMGQEIYVTVERLCRQSLDRFLRRQLPSREGDFWSHDSGDSRRPTWLVIQHTGPRVHARCGPSGGGDGRACYLAGRGQWPRSWCGSCACSGRRPSRPRRPLPPAWWSARPCRWPAGQWSSSRRRKDRCTSQVTGNLMVWTRRPTNSGGYAPTPASAMKEAAASGWRIHCSAWRSVAISCRTITSAWSSRAR
jgi:hypothetical protein